MYATAVCVGARMGGEFRSLLLDGIARESTFQLLVLLPVLARARGNQGRAKGGSCTYW